MTLSYFTVRKPHEIRLWLLICAAMVFVMVILGGATRLTGSGLSMVEWQPLTILPPMSDSDWQSEFKNYQKYPEFQKINFWMTVDDFKSIFWLEYIHRLWGRLIGVVFAVPFFCLLVSRQVQGNLVWTLAGLLVLGGGQGLLGWLMVASGLIDRPDVSHYRLAAHLILAFVVYGLLIWVALGIRGADDQLEERPHHHTAIGRLALGVTLTTLLVVMSGALVAGLNAGFIYNTFPLMDGEIIPNGLYDMSPWYQNWFENIMTVQFNHRILGIILAGLVAFTWWRIKRTNPSHQMSLISNLFLAAGFIQVGLGISTLLFIVPFSLALAHQTGALILFTLSVIIARMMHPAPIPSAAEPPARTLNTN